MRLDDRELLAKTLQAEAGNQGLGGMLAVGSVIRNRMKQGGSLSDVILAPAQFSAWNKVTGAAGGEQGQDMAALKPSKDAYAAADAILTGSAPDITGGATHYYNPSISQPAWGKEKSGGDWTKIGAHIFGKAGDFRTGAAKMNGTQTPPMQMFQEQQPQQRPRGLLGGLDQDFAEKLYVAALAGSPNAAQFAPLVQGVMQRGKERRAAARTTAQANATADYLERIGQTDLANLLRQGGIDARTALAAGAGATKDTADIREYNLAVSQGYKGTFADWQQTGKKRTEVGTIPQGYQLVEGRNDAGEVVLRLEPIKGGPADIAEAEEAKRTQELKTAGIITGAIDKIQDKLKTTTLPIAGFAGAQLSKVAGTNAYDVSALVQTIRANIGFDKLQAMRDASPTGGALGQVSNQEIAFLQSTLNNLDQGQTTAQFTEQLNLLENMYNRVIRKLNAYPDEAKRLAGYSDIGISDGGKVEPSGGATDDDLLKKYGG